MIDLYPIPTVCPYCGSPVFLTSNAEVYGKAYGNGKCYKCTVCDSYVGVHDHKVNGAYIPLGRLANRELRELKKQCHALFDPTWQKDKRLNRDKAYGRLANRLGIPIEECHFGWFDKDRLLRALEILRSPGWHKGVSSDNGAPVVQCIRCMKRPHQIKEYVDASKSWGISPEEYVRQEEGTYNPATGRFYCTSCYVAAGMPLGMAGMEV